MRNLLRKPKQVLTKEGEDGKVGVFLSNHLLYLLASPVSLYPQCCGLLLCHLWGHKTLCALPGLNPPPSSLRRMQRVLSCAVPEVVASESCWELLFYEGSVMSWDQWELVAQHCSAFYASPPEKGK